MTDIFPLTLKGATVTRRGRTILGPIDLTLGGAGLTMIIGPNGSGKTSLLRVMHGVERLSKGSADWATSDADARPRQSYVFQQPIMLRRSVAANLRYPLALRKVPGTEAQQAVAAWARRIGLARIIDSPAPRLSGGERQKLALARALITNPRVLFLDEPCANLDGRATREIEALLLDVRDAGTRIVMATHDMGQARRLATDAIFMLGGAVHEHGPPDDFFRAPKTAELAAFLNGDIIG